MNGLLKGRVRPARVAASLGVMLVLGALCTLAQAGTIKVLGATGPSGGAS